MGTFILIAAFSYVVAAIFVIVGRWLRTKLCRRLDAALVAQGTVVSLDRASLQEAFHPVVAYCDAQGVEHRFRSAVGSYPASHKVGDKVEVFYNPQSPDEAIIDAKDFARMSRICFLAAGLAVVLGTAVLVLSCRSR